MNKLDRALQGRVPTWLGCLLLGLVALTDLVVLLMNALHRKDPVIEWTGTAVLALIAMAALRAIGAWARRKLPRWMTRDYP